MAQGFTVWLTGLPASGKGEIAEGLEEALLERGLDAERLDGGDIREDWLSGLGFTETDEDGITRLLGHVCLLLSRNGVIAVAASVSASRDIRNEIRSEIGRFIEIYVNCPAGECEKRDNSGNWAKARAGQIKGFPGVDAPYEEPVNPEVLVQTETAEVESCVTQILKTLEIMEWIPRVAGSDYDAADEEKITKRLKDLGYI